MGCSIAKRDEFSYQNDPHWLGYRPLAPHTKATYEGHYKQMFQHCCIKGDYESLLILLLPGSTEGVPSFEVNTAKQFVRVKRTQKIQSCLMLMVPYVWWAWRPSVYRWRRNAPGKANQVRTVISILHKAHCQTGTYLEPCTMCMAMPKGKKKNGCTKHANIEPKLFWSGNTATNPTFKNTSQKSQKEGANWIEKGNSQLLPSDLCMLRTHLLSTNKLVGL